MVLRNAQHCKLYYSGGGNQERAKSQSDWTIHVMFAAQLLRGELAAVHIGFHIAVIALSGGQIGWMWLGAWVVGVASVNLTFDVLYRWFHGSGFRRVCGCDKSRPYEHKRGGREMLCLVSAFVKPNMALILLPALVVVGGWQVWRMRHIDRAVVVSGACWRVTGVQYVAQYALIDGQDGGMIVAPLQSMMQYEPDVLALIGKGLLSAAFPISVAVVYGMRQSRRAAGLFSGGGRNVSDGGTGARGRWDFGGARSDFSSVPSAPPPGGRTMRRMILALHIAGGHANTYPGKGGVTCAPAPTT